MCYPWCREQVVGWNVRGPGFKSDLGIIRIKDDYSLYQMTNKIIRSKINPRIKFYSFKTKNFYWQFYLIIKHSFRITKPTGLHGLAEEACGEQAEDNGFESHKDRWNFCFYFNIYYICSYRKKKIRDSIAGFLFKKYERLNLLGQRAHVNETFKS